MRCGSEPGDPHAFAASGVEAVRAFPRQRRSSWAPSGYLPQGRIEEAQTQLSAGLASQDACDTIANINAHALEVNSDLIAFAMLTFAYSTESVNGVPGKKVPGPAFTLPAPAGPEGTFVEENAAGLAHRPRK
jgi:hypothetical protein